MPTRVSQLANDAGYVTTDEKVKQTPNTTSLDSHPILFSASDSNGEVVGGTYKNPDFYYNPNLNRMIFKNGGGIEVRSGATNVSILSYILLSDPTDAHSIMNITTEDIELDDVTYQGTTYSNTWDGTNSSLKTAISSLKQSVSKIGTFYTYNWTANSSNAYGTQLTQKMTLPKGVYIMIGVSPVISVTECAISLTSNKTMNAPFVFNIVRNRTPLAYTFQVTEDNTDV